MGEDIPNHYECAAQPLVDSMRVYTRGWTADAARDFPIHRDEWRPLSIFGNETPDQQKHAAIIDAFCNIIASLITMEVVTKRQATGGMSLMQQRLVAMPNEYQVISRLSPRTEGVWLTILFSQRLPTLGINNLEGQCLLQLGQIRAIRKHPTEYVTTNDMLGLLDGSLAEERAHLSKLPVGSPFYVPYKN